MRNLILTIVLIVGFSTHAITQDHSFRFNSAFFLTNAPVFGLGYEFSDQGSCTFDVLIEGGRYTVKETNLLTSTLEDYSIAGVGTTLSLRRYLSLEPREENIGFFIAPYMRYRFLREYTLEGEVLSAEGLDLTNASSKQANYHSLQFGGALGYKAGFKMKGLHIEGILGYGSGWAFKTGNQDVIELNPTVSKYQKFLKKSIRFEFSVVYTI